MALDIGRLISEIYSGLTSPSSTWARRDMAIEKKKALDEEAQRKMELQKQIDAGAAQRVELANAGSLATQGAVNTGALARQALANTGAAEVAGITGKAGLEGHQAMAEAHRYAADKTLEGSKYKTDEALEANKNLMERGLRTEQVKGLTAILGQAGASPEDKQAATTALLSIGKDDNKVTGIRNSIIQDSVKTTQTPAPAITAPSVTANRPGAQSMEFRSGPSPEEEERKRRKMNRLAFYGTKFENE